MRKMVELKKINNGNLGKWRLCPSGTTRQTFVATNARSLMQAYVALSEGHVALPFAIYADGAPVGFLMFGYGATGRKRSRLWRQETLLPLALYDRWALSGEGLWQGRAPAGDRLSEDPPLRPGGLLLALFSRKGRTRRQKAAAFRDCGNRGTVCGDEVVAMLRLSRRRRAGSRGEERPRS